MSHTKTLQASQQFKVVVLMFVLITVIEVINLFTGRFLNQFGNIPRHLAALPGIVIGPFLHGNIWHYTSNIVPLCIFTFLMLQHGTKRFAWLSCWIVLITGLLVWLFGRQAIHIGMSGLLYGYFGYLLLAGFISRKPKLIGISLVVGFFYGGLIFGVLPAGPFVSWESHLFGFLSGVAGAKLFVTKDDYS